MLIILNIRLNRLTVAVTMRSLVLATSIVLVACSSSGTDPSDAAMDEAMAENPGPVNEEIQSPAAESPGRLASRISELDGSETLLDTETGLVWVNDVRFCMAGITRAEDATCNVLSDMAVSGKTDWRVPNSMEMSELILAVVDDPTITLNYINPSCAVMTATDGWVFTENSSSPGVLSPIQPGNAGVRCVSGESRTETNTQ